MNRLQLKPGLHFWLKGREYVIKQRLANGEFQICEVVTEVLSKIAYTALVQFEDACLSLGIAIQYSPPKMPWYKSAIERYFGAVNSQLLSDIPGKSFSNFMKRYDYNPLKNAVISFEALQEMLHIFIVDIHNQSSHPGFKSPRASVWSKAIEEFPPALPSSHQELKVLIGNITTRKITRKGVEFEGLIYNSWELSRFCSSESGKTTVKYDPTDLS